MRWLWLLLPACSYEPRAADRVVDTTPMPDAFEAARDCPADYTVALDGQSSRYRVIVTGRRPWEHSDDCTDDLAGATHLAAIDNQAELDGIEGAVNRVDNLPGNKAWLGGVQLRGQENPSDGWLSVTGGPFIMTAWDDNEPNDVGGNENDEENFAGVERDRDGLVDFPNDSNFGGVCECDGLPLDPAAAAAIDANRN